MHASITVFERGSFQKSSSNFDGQWAALFEKKSKVTRPFLKKARELLGPNREKNAFIAESAKAESQTTSPDAKTRGYLSIGQLVGFAHVLTSHSLLRGYSISSCDVSRNRTSAQRLHTDRSIHAGFLAGFLAGSDCLCLWSAM